MGQSVPQGTFVYIIGGGSGLRRYALSGLYNHRRRAVHDLRRWRFNPCLRLFAGQGSRVCIAGFRRGLLLIQRIRRGGLRAVCCKRILIYHYYFFLLCVIMGVEKGPLLFSMALRSMGGGTAFRLTTKRRPISQAARCGVGWLCVFNGFWQLYIVA